MAECRSIVNYRGCGGRDENEPIFILPLPTIANPAKAPYIQPTRRATRRRHIGAGIFVSLQRAKSCAKAGRGFDPER